MYSVYKWIIKNRYQGTSMTKLEILITGALLMTASTAMAAPNAEALAQKSNCLMATV
jgi:hypothetical protein